MMPNEYELAVHVFDIATWLNPKVERLPEVNNALGSPRSNELALQMTFCP